MNTELVLSNFDDRTPLTIEASDATLSLSVADVLAWIAPGAPKPEAFKFLIKCRSLRLNPFADEIFLVPMGSRWGTIVAKAGYLKRAQERSEYEGFTAGIIIQKIVNAQKGEFGETQEIEGACLPKGWIVIGGWCRVYRRGHPRPYYISVGTEYYKDGSDAWKRNAPTMYRKVAVAQAHREAFAIGDSYDESEAPMDLAPVRMPGRPPVPATPEAEVIETTAEPAAPIDFGTPVQPETFARLTALIAEAALDPVEISGMLERRGVMTGRLEDLDEPGAQSCVRGIEEILGKYPFETDEPAGEAESFKAANAARREPKTRKTKTEATAGEPATRVS